MTAILRWDLLERTWARLRMRAICSLEHSISPQDVKYQFTGAVSYDLPVGKGRAMDLNGVGDAVLGGWTGNLIAYFSTGVPIASPTVGAGIAYFNQRPDSHAIRQAARRTTPPRGSTTTASRYHRVLLWPAAHLHISTTCVRWERRISTFRFTSTLLSARRRIFGFEIASYNIANRAQLGMPNVPSLTNVYQQLAANPTPSPASDEFGLITATVNSPRQFQFGGRFTF